MRKEKEIKELEAQLAFLPQGGGDDEYNRLMQIYEQEKRTLNELYHSRRDNESVLQQLRARHSSLEQTLYSIKARFSTIDEEILSSRKKYMALKVPPKVGYYIGKDEEEEYVERKVLVPTRRTETELNAV